MSQLGGVCLCVMVILSVAIGKPLPKKRFNDVATRDTSPFPPNGRVSPGIAALLAKGATDETFREYVHQRRHIRFADVFAHTRFQGPTPRAMQCFDVFVNNATRLEVAALPTNRSVSVFFIPFPPGKSTFGVTLNDVMRKLSGEHPPIVVIGGEDNHIMPSDPFVKLVRDELGAKHIFCEVLSEHISGVRVMPLGFTPKYQVGANTDETMDMLITGIDFEAKAGILAAWGKYWPYLNHVIKSRVEAQEWVDNAGDWVDHRMIDSENWYTELSKYRFMISPTGNGIQSPKIMEAILVGTIPICETEEAFVDLQAMGYPIVVVNKWSDITPEKLDIWWERLSPSLHQARWMLASEVWFAYLTREPFIANIFHFLDTFLGPSSPISTVGASLEDVIPKIEAAENSLEEDINVMIEEIEVESFEDDIVAIDET